MVLCQMKYVKLFSMQSHQITNPICRNVVGNDANSLLEKRKNMSEREFLKTIYKNVFESS